MHVTATNTSLFDVNTDIVIITEFRDFAVLNRDVFDAVQHEGGVLSYQLQSIHHEIGNIRRLTISALVTEGDILILGEEYV